MFCFLRPLTRQDLSPETFLSILDSRILTEAQEYGVDGHVIDIEEQDGYSVGKNHHHLKLNGSKNNNFLTQCDGLEFIC